MDAVLILLWGILWGGACAIVASYKNRTKFGWFILGLLFSFLAMIVLAIIPPSRKRRRDDDDMLANDLKACPFCAERVKSAAVLCRYCGKEI